MHVEQRHAGKGSVAPRRQIEFESFRTKADIDRNGTVNALDLTVILSAWTET